LRSYIKKNFSAIYKKISKAELFNRIFTTKYYKKAPADRKKHQGLIAAESSLDAFRHEGSTETHLKCENAQRRLESPKWMI